MRAEGGGHRFVFQAVTEYLIYWALAQARPPGEDEVAYWRRRAAPTSVFAEYAGAFQVLLRDWISRGSVDRIAPLLQQAPGWLEGQLVRALIDVARASHLPGRGSPVAEAVGAALAQTTGSGVAWALVTAGAELGATRFAASGLPYVRAGCTVASAGRGTTHDVGDVDRAAFLIQSLTRHANILDDEGATDQAVATYRQAIEIYQAHPLRAGLEIRVARTLVELATVHHRTGGPTGLKAARELCERAVEFCQRRWEEEPADAEVGRQLAWALNTLGNVVDELGQPDAAVSAYGPAIGILEGLVGPGPQGAGCEDPRLSSPTSERMSWRRTSRRGRQALRRAVDIREAEWAATPEDVGLGHGLLKVLTTLGEALVRRGAVPEGVAMLGRAMQVHESVAKGSPSGAEWPLMRARLMGQAALLLRAVGRVGEAAAALKLAAPVLEPKAGAALEEGDRLAKAGQMDKATAVYVQGIEFSRFLWMANPEDMTAALRLTQLANKLPSDLALADYDAAAEQYGRLACEITDSVWAVHPRSIELGRQVYKAQLFLGGLLRDTDRLEAAVEPFRRAERVAAILVALAPGHPGFLAAQAQALMDLGRLQEARVLVEAALRLDPGFPWAVMLRQNLDARR